MKRFRDMLAAIEPTGRGNVITLTMEPSDPHALPPAMAHAWRASSELIADLHELKIRRTGIEAAHAESVSQYQRDMASFERQIAEKERAIRDQHDTILTMLGNIGITTEDVE